MPNVETIVGLALTVTALVFLVAFRFAAREWAGASDRIEIPRAQVLPGKGGAMRLVQAGFVALGITSIFVMVVCALGIVALMIAG